MRVISKKKIVDYYIKHPQSKTALEEWYTETCNAQWKTYSDVKKTFSSVDAVGNQHYIFNIKGNDFRLIVVIQFTPGLVYIRFIGTHSEYDKIKDASKI